MRGDRSKMELLEMKDKITDLFHTDIDNLGNALMEVVNNNDTEKYDMFCKLFEQDLSVDWLQMVYQYYHADRKEKKQDYTPKSLAVFLSKLIGEADVVIDMCAGSGALTIQRWAQNHDQKFRLYELDENVIPFLLFNLAVRNIDSSVCMADVLQDEVYKQWIVKKGEKYGRVACVKSTL